MSRTRPSLTLTLLQAREAAMAFFRPALNEHGLTEQQWRVIRILNQHKEVEVYRLAELACILKPSMTGVLNRMIRDGYVIKRKSDTDQRRVHVRLTEKGENAFAAMKEDMERNYQRIQDQFGKDKMQELLQLLNEFKKINP
ncbi:homoprotocatechuate degradation operon regulator HpaR [Marinobacter sp. GN3S48]|uniref:homoprotocatechuate degradation operon regulator HpaR n=1 Tax=Marinobacter sp. GN3S48 TaxID=3382302 RepID=UPI00387AC080